MALSLALLRLLCPAQSIYVLSLPSLFPCCPAPLHRVGRGHVGSVPFFGLSMGRVRGCLFWPCMGAIKPGCKFPALMPGAKWGGLFSGGPMPGASLWSGSLFRFRLASPGAGSAALNAAIKIGFTSVRSDPRLLKWALIRGCKFRKEKPGLFSGYKNREPVPQNQPPVSFLIPPLTGTTWPFVGLLFLGVSTPQRCAACACFYCWKKRAL